MIELKNISAGYGKHLVLKDVSISFEKGKLTSIIGVNGCGKSTLLKTILNMIPLKKGDILLDGNTISNMTRTDIARKAAYLAQGKNTPDMTVEQLVLHGRFPHLNYPRRYSQKDQKIAFEAMTQMGITTFAHKPLHTLSGGIRQNAYIAMALAQDTDYILLDEPTTYLDITHQLELMKTCKSLVKNGKGIIAVMHDLPMALTFSDRIVLLNEGTIVSYGKPKQLHAQGDMEQIFRLAIEVAEDGEHYYYKYTLGL